MNRDWGLCSAFLDSNISFVVEHISFPSENTESTSDDASPDVVVFEDSASTGVLPSPILDHFVVKKPRGRFGNSNKVIEGMGLPVRKKSSFLHDLRSAYEDKGVEFGDGTVQSQLRKLLESREE